ncbi:flagellar biosynthesis protein FlgE [Hydrocarboniclastica marina]|uniref:Flagellar biosynthesis protein FlgE n=1 Tax=Hydrocarboniclastica marina TaxID=2259620 RepID=A0A4P7XJQ2_9ALTE|nr:flagellar biosynthesis protein FlgE [Hydrocarboniclastica marina]MAL97502.1 flagellar biosynthesis protein FlgE [Alteromonadaceae bacterium]QCF26602.1 flagellar biosynthesis protein FlgE [Hydrocarboniclastica marina]|tara:strand:+ start:904 stop:1161 length:258 start_codon:yes stop_codon:yes gene_type:complete
MINGVLGSGLQGVQQGIIGMDTAARKIVSAGVESEAGTPTGRTDAPGSVAESLIDLKLYERNVQASSQVVKTANEMVGTLLDTSA